MAKLEYAWVWSCCYCRDINGQYRSCGMTTNIEFCPECSHQRCSSCRCSSCVAETVRLRDGRYVYTPSLPPPPPSPRNSIVPRSAFVSQNSSIAQSSSRLASQISSSRSEDDHRETPGNESSSMLESDGPKEVSWKASSPRHSPAASTAETSSFSLPDISDMSLGQTSHPSDNASPMEQTISDVPMVTEVGDILSNDDALPLNHTLNSPMVKFAEDPTSYFDHISSLSKRVWEFFPNSLHNIRMDNEDAVLFLPDLSIKEYSSYSVEIKLDFDDSLGRLSAILNGVNLLQNEGFTTSSFNIIVVDSKRYSTLNVVPISIPTLNTFFKLLHEAASKLPVSEMDQILDDISEVLLHITSSIGLNIPHIPNNLLQWEKWQAINSLQSSIVIILHFALLSFIRSHVDVAGQTPTGVLGEGLQIRTFGGTVFMAPRCLRCLNGFLKQPVWAFHFEPASSTLNTFNFKEFYLSTSVQDFAQLWGPVKYDVQTSRNPNTRSIDVRGGTIRRVEPSSSSESVTTYDNEVLCHWFGWLDEEPQCGVGGLEIPLTKHLLIGAPGTRRKLTGLTILETCPCLGKDKYCREFPIFELRTKLPSWYKDAISSQISAGKYITVSLGCTYKFDSGWTLKDSIIEDWIDSKVADSNPLHQPYQSYLDFLSVVEISRCTGNARRISLWTLLKNPGLNPWFEARFDKTAYQEVIQTIKQHCAIEHISKEWHGLSPEYRKTLTFVFKCILSELRFTGVGDDNLLQVWDITEAERRDGRKLNPQWTSMVKDSVGCATFAIMTPSCMIHSDPKDRMIDTMICVDTSGLEERPGRATSGRDEYARFSSIWGVAQSESPAVGEHAQREPENGNDAEKVLIERMNQRQRSRKAGNVLAAEQPNGATRDYLQDTSVAAAAAAAVAAQPIMRDIFTHGKPRCEQSNARRLREPKIPVGGYFQFVNGTGKKLGRLILEPHDGPNNYFDVRRLSPSTTILTRWKEYRSLGLLDRIGEREEALDRTVETWAQRSKGFLPWIASHLLPKDDTIEAWTATEFIRGPNLTDHERIFRSIVK